MTSELMPARYVLTPSQLSAAVKLAGISPSPGSELSHLPPPAHEGNGSLQGAGVLGSDGAICREASHALRIIAGADQVAVVQGHRTGTERVAVARFLSARNETGFVVLDRDGAAWDIAYLATLDQALAMIDDLLHVSAMPAGADGPAVTVPAVGFATLIAATDAVHETKVRQHLERQRAGTVHSLNAQTLSVQIEQGLKSEDTRWAVSALATVAGEVLAACAPAMEDGLAALGEAGLAEVGPRGWLLTELGDAYVRALSQLVHVGSVTLMQKGGPREIEAGTFLVLRTVTTVLLGGWTQYGQPDAKVTVQPADASMAMHAVRALIDPAVAMPEVSAPQTPGFPPPPRRGSTDATPPPPSGSFPPPLPTGPPPQPGQAPPRPPVAGSSPPPPAAPAAACPKCGGHLEGQPRFCIHCGARLR